MLKQMKNLGIKTSLKMIVPFLIIGIFGTLIGACFYMLYETCTMLVAGTSSNAISLNLFLKGVFISFPISMGLSAMMLTLYFIRHPALPFIPILTYAILLLAAWFVLIPVCSKFSLNYETKTESVKNKNNLSSNLFRKNDSLVTYFSKVYNDNFANGLCLNISSDSPAIYTFKNVPLDDNKKTFSDSLIAESIEMPKLISYIMNDISVLIDAGKKAIKSWKAENQLTFSASFFKGISHWLCFISIGLALMSVIGLRRVSNWRLLNTFIVIFATFSITSFNSIYYRKNIYEAASAIVGKWFCKMTYIHEPFEVFVNVVIFVLFSVTGLLIDIFKKNNDLDKMGNPV